MNLRNYFHTLRYLKLTQIANRLYRKIRAPLNTEAPVVPLQASDGVWQVCQLNNQSLYTDGSCCFLNCKGESNKWFVTGKEKLWLYNLHYFDDLTAVNADDRCELHQQRLFHWVDDNTVLQGDGWEPYPLSLRIVNWVKFVLNGNELDQSICNSLALQVHVLSQDLEYHILGNHLFANAKALIFAGCFFSGDTADKWLEAGLKILQQQLPEQILEDGGNFELTPMYHAIMLVDLLDLTNLFTAYPDSIELDILDFLKVRVDKMLSWLMTMNHVDGEISFFNDSVLGIAPPNQRILSYAQSLGFLLQNSVCEIDTLLLSDFKDAGYIVVQSAEFKMIADLSPIGPDYIPGHAHADTLSFEFSLGKQRVFVNSGIDRYGLDDERLRQRKTPAHNTLSVNGLDSSEVWSGFRVARRARIVDRKIVIDDVDKKSFYACHDGFKQQGVKCLHKRSFTVTKDTLLVEDKLIGSFKQAESYLHLHPDIVIISVSKQQLTLQAGCYQIDLTVKGGVIKIEDSFYHPQFGLRLENKKISIQIQDSLQTISIKWFKFN